MRFSLTTLYVSDLERSLKFYNGMIGLPILKRQSMGSGGEIAFLGEEDNVHLELISSEKKFSYDGFSIGFEVENLDAAKERLAAEGYKIEREFSPARTMTLCFFHGPDGEEVELVENK